jgi:SEC-C motif-containing protein
MRSRYTAYALKDAEYVVASHDPEHSDDTDLEATRDWAERTTWLGLEVLDTKAGDPDDERGEVEFVARFADEQGDEQRHHERSSFVRRAGRWYFQDGKVVPPPPVRRAPKIGRNEPCPCGSGKKHKKCCGVYAA